MSEELFARLARLRREKRPPVATEPSRAGLPSWFRARLGEELGEGAGAPPRAGCTLEAPAGLCEQAGPRGVFAARLRRFGLAHLHGDWCLGEGLRASAEELAWLARDPSLAELGLERCVFLDIETTGLSGGAGTIPFLVGLGSFEASPEGDGLEFWLWQAFLRDPGEESAALLEVAERIRAASGVVSFFGKSFDRHRLEDKMRVHRIEPPFDGKPHLDLYHPLRRLYRGAFVDGRLATLEHGLCGVTRLDDLSGGFAPEAWFDFLAGRPHRLEGVFLHNELDVLSLVSLAAHLACTRKETRPDGRPLSGSGRARAQALAAQHSTRREHGEALEWLERALVREKGDDGPLRFRRAEALRKTGELGRALEEFQDLARGRHDPLGALAWGEVLRLARRMGRAELLEEARTLGRAAVEQSLTGRARLRALASYERKEARSRIQGAP